MKVYQRIAHCLKALESCNAEWIEKHESTLGRIEREFLPNGSGFDAGCKILDDSTPQRIRIQCDFHKMDENGYYCGGASFVCVVRPSMMFGFDVRIVGRDWQNLKDYVGDTMHHMLDSEFKE